ncbi:hypothetical protein ABT052_34230 [Streptomyces sp. NPDC002766]|uniref:hypothetical protein n=1 Tax=unclassified Streptomyces TaxID=2593676 RepID=UPI0033307E6D
MVTYFRCWSALSRSNRAEAKSPDEILLDGRPDGESCRTSSKNNRRWRRSPTVFHCSKPSSSPGPAVLRSGASLPTPTICNATVSLPTRTVNGWRGCTVEIDPEATASSNWEAALAGQLDKL